jgi:hypothetical protein
MSYNSHLQSYVYAVTLYDRLLFHGELKMQNIALYFVSWAPF